MDVILKSQLSILNIFRIYLNVDKNEADCRDTVGNNVILICFRWAQTYLYMH